MSNTSNHPNAWTEAEDAHIRDRYLDHGWSAGKIAQELPGRTRNAVIGRIHRQGWKRDFSKAPAHFLSRHPSGKPTLPRTHRRRALDGLTFTSNANTPQYQERVQPASGPIASPNAKVWTERDFGECAYPVSGEGADTVSCCNHTQRTYCDAHARVMHGPTWNINYGSVVGHLGHTEHKRKASRRPTFEEWAAA